MQKFNNPQWNSHKKYSVSVLIPFYNNFEFLKMVLAGLERQSFRDFEVVICDDGSNSTVVSDLKKYIADLPLAIQHLWHEDMGFRKNRVLNLGIKQSLSDFLVFIDADCVVHPQFIQDYFESKKEKTALSGRRVELSPWITKKLDAEKIRSGYLEKNLWWILLCISFRKDSNSPKGLHIKNAFLRKLINRKPRPIVGSNFAGNKIDFESVNGFDIRYEGVGIGEDSDIDYRLQLSGVKIEPMANMAIQFHLWHPYKDRPNANEALFEKVKADKIAKTSFGLSEM